MVAVTTPDGMFVWSLDPGRPGIANPSLATNGPNLLAYGGGSVSVIDRSGTVIGHGTSAPNRLLYPAPTGLSWARRSPRATDWPPLPTGDWPRCFGC
jgi:hypothetical protein